MINTVNIKQQQLKNGFFKTGSGPTNILIMGSCRVVNYVNYFAAIPQFTVYSIDPFNWNWNVNDDRVEYIGALTEMETHAGLLQMLAGCKIFIHEYYQNAGMFNVSKEKDKTIFDFGMNPELDICIPNFNDLFILFTDIIKFDVDIRNKATQDFNVLGKLSAQTISDILAISNKNIDKFFEVCRRSDLSEMADYFIWKEQRFFWSYNHVTKFFTLSIFELLNVKFFNGTLAVDENHVDMFANNFTPVTEYDVKHLGINWNEPVKKLQL